MKIRELMEKIFGKEEKKKPLLTLENIAVFIIGLVMFLILFLMATLNI